mgnify:CR=1 FL=1
MAEYDNNGIKLFGFEITRANKKTSKKEELPSIVPPLDDDGSGYVTAAGSYHGSYIDLSGDQVKDDKALILKYREVAQYPEIDAAIDDITNEVISGEDKVVELNIDEVKTTTSIKKQIKEEFDHIAAMLDFQNYGHDIFRRYYIDGRIYHHLLVDPKNPNEGIQEIRPIDSTKIRKVKEVTKEKDPVTGANLVKKVDEYYLYSEDRMSHITSSSKNSIATNAIKITPDAISYVTSGLLDVNRQKVVSYLHKAIKAVNQLRMMEDAQVIYRLSRAPERRIFYIDVGNLPRGKAEQYLKDIMTRYRNKLVYDVSSGDLKSETKHMSMLEDFWLPRREGGKGTEISTLPGGQNLGEIEDIVYFQKKLNKALNVPIGRLNPEDSPGGLLGRASEITRDEYKFQKFVLRLRKRFAELFLNILKKQLLLKGIITEDDWEEWKPDIVVDYITDNYFVELKNTEMLRERLGMLNEMEAYLGQFFSKEWVQKNVLQFTDDEIRTMKKQMDAEEASGEIDPAMGAEDEEPAPEKAPVPKKEAPAPEKAPAPKKEEQQEHSDSYMMDDKQLLETEALQAEIVLLNKLTETLDD